MWWKYSHSYEVKNFLEHWKNTGKNTNRISRTVFLGVIVIEATFDCVIVIELHFPSN